LNYSRLSGIIFLEDSMNPNAFAHRKSALTLHLTKPGGGPLANQTVKLEQKRHQFLFGVGGFEAVALAGETVPGGKALSHQERAKIEECLDRIFSLCNYATLPFYWGRYESEEGKPMEAATIAAARYYAERGIVTKGHPLCWHTVCAPWLMKYSNAEILRRQLARIDRDVSAFKGLIDMWDVINEAVIMPIFDKYDNAMTRVCRDLGRVRMIKEVFTAARKANPQATLLLNDFETSSSYEILVDGCLNAGIPIDVIGIQSHQHQGYWGKEKLLEVLDRYSYFGKPIHFTENTIISGDIMPPHIVDLNDWQVESWPSTPEGEERQAGEITEMYEILFAHPAVEAVSTWDSTDGRWLHAPSGLLRADNSIKPAYTSLMNKIKGEWWTRGEFSTDAEGNLEIYGFRGDYEISCRDIKAPFSLNGRHLELQLQLQLELA
jgi:GH35 family endo-1,4-beta-xylanase